MNTRHEQLPDTATILHLDHQLTPAWARLFQTLTEFRAATIVITATELGLFDNAPTEGESVSAAADRLGITPVSTRVLLNALSGLGFVLKDAQSYTVPPDIRALFSSDVDRNVKHNILAFRREIEVWLRMPQILRRTEQAPEEYSRELLDNRIRKFAGLMMLNRLDAESILERIQTIVATLGTVLDLGGGDGFYARRIVESNPEARVDVLDLDGAFELCEEQNAVAIREQRIQMIKGDARTFEPSREYDLVMINELLELFPEDEKLLIADRACRSVKPGGHLIVTKFPLDAAGTGPSRFPIFSMRMHLKFPGSFLETETEIQDMFESLGLRLGEKIDALRSAFIFTKTEDLNQ